VRLASDLPSQDELVARYTEYVLQHTGGNKGQAARILGIGTNTLWRRLKGRQE
jgi:DNA-binding NtrC family response regulator